MTNFKELVTVNTVATTAAYDEGVYAHVLDVWAQVLDWGRDLYHPVIALFVAIEN